VDLESLWLSGDTDTEGEKGRLSMAFQNRGVKWGVAETSTHSKQTWVENRAEGQ